MEDFFFVNRAPVVYVLNENVGSSMRASVHIVQQANISFCFYHTFTFDF